MTALVGGPVGPPGVYVHIPFCVRKCHYCAFNSYPIEPLLAERYVRALLREIDTEGEAASHGSTLYVGGGTPTSIGADRLARVVSRCIGAFNIPADAEITVECNPATIDADGLRLLREAGVNRLSIGAQAFQDNLLRRLGRIHSAADVDATVHGAREAGFTNINLDLMFGIPGQRVREWEESLRHAIELGPEHVSAYPLEMDEGTLLSLAVARGEESIPPEEAVVEMWEAAIERLGSSGYERYEISNYALQGRACRHNLVYWENGDYVGLGAGAASHLGCRRYSNASLPARYCDLVEAGRRPVAVEEPHSLDDEMVDTVLMGLRLTRGMSLAAFRGRFGRDVSEVFPGVLDRLSELGLVEIDANTARLTGAGLFLANAVFREFVRVSPHRA